MRFKIYCTSLQLEGNLPFLLYFILYSRANSKYKPPGTCIRRGDLTEGFCIMSMGGLYLEELIIIYIHGGAYLHNFTVFKLGMSSVMSTTKSS